MVLPPLSKAPLVKCTAPVRGFPPASLVKVVLFGLRGDSQCVVVGSRSFRVAVIPDHAAAEAR